jgi:hypothetical protein
LETLDKSMKTALSLINDAKRHVNLSLSKVRAASDALSATLLNLRLMQQKIEANVLARKTRRVRATGCLGRI